MMLLKVGKVTISLIVINFVLFTLQIILGDWFTKLFSLTPALAFNGAYWQFFTYMFMHGSIMHVALNMFVLMIFGIRIEETLGKMNFIILYILAGLGSAGLYMLLTGFGSTVLMLGASGAVFGVLTAYAFLYPKEIIWIFPGIPLPAILAIVLLAGFELFSGLFGLQAGIANFGHLGGIIVGAIFMIIYKQIGRHGSKEHDDIEFIWN
ncbi:MAG: rhomboid family intramembrane serine protease [Nanoarchaeota archaeon]|nr:rhomboid family intramembrane serine protease [Nanoarchaeota archaeon]MBU1135818.1 rhomboid family intramembrane serine protease [Nanoarchaeota archaeon]MBU2520221.1 rhomboid family intramembrane serine protease [Nanoarchaeota archaeon]